MTLFKSFFVSRSLQFCYQWCTISLDTFCIIFIQIFSYFYSSCSALVTFQVCFYISPPSSPKRKENPWWANIKTQCRQGHRGAILELTFSWGGGDYLILLWTSVKQLIQFCSQSVLRGEGDDWEQFWSAPGQSVQNFLSFRATIFSNNDCILFSWIILRSKTKHFYALWPHHLTYTNNHTLRKLKTSIIYNVSLAEGKTIKMCA